jgi:serine/threonine-protein kinase HipA
MTENRTDKTILVYADWLGLDSIKPLGKLHVQYLRGKEIFSFEYDREWIGTGFSHFLDPNLGFYRGTQYLPEEKLNFGLFLDSSPDRWGRMLMRRREAVQSRNEGRKESSLNESDYLLGVFDGHRMGGLRFKLEDSANFLNDNKVMASPPWTSLRDLENASLQLERDDVTEDPRYEKWLSLLVDPGSSLGGARPKASVIDDMGQLWIAKFPGRKDTRDTGAWELVLKQLAEECGISVPDARVIKLSGHHHTYLSKRFDRTIDGKRIHYASAMSLLGHSDGESFREGVSYLELVEFIIRNSSRSADDLEQLWRRILFNVLVSNTDDHLRNHGFLLTPEGWRLSPAFDMNPDEAGTGLKLNISENDNSLNSDLVIEVAPWFRLSQELANKILQEMITVVRKWSDVAKNAGLSKEERQMMLGAFRNT